MRHTLLSTAILLAVALPLASCSGDVHNAAASVMADSARRDAIRLAREDSIRRHRPGYIIDSALSPEEALRRFRANISVVPSALVGGAASRETLVRRFARALQARDTIALRNMLLSRAEFAYLVYPSSRYTRPPYQQPPGIVWYQYTVSSDKGLTRLLSHVGGQPLNVIGVDCPAPPDTEGENRFWRACHARRVRAPGDTILDDLFGTIIERDGRMKFVSYANKY